MNLRVFKKDIEYFIGEFIEDCDLFVLLNPQQDSAEIDAIIEESVDLYNSLKQRAAHPEGPKKAYYNGLIKEMFEKLDELSDSGRTKIIQGSRVVALDFFVRRRQTDSQEDERKNGGRGAPGRSTGVRERTLSGKSAPEGPFPAQRLGAQVDQASTETLHEGCGKCQAGHGTAKRWTKGAGHGMRGKCQAGSALPGAAQKVLNRIFRALRCLSCRSILQKG